MPNVLHWYLLWFLPLAAIPLILHLLTLHRLRTVELSTFRFLFDSYVQQRRRMKFLEALIAILRTAFLLFLIVAVSRPVFQHWTGLFGRSGGRRDVVMLIDTSASMGTKSEGQSALQRAKQTALKVVQRLGAEDRVTVIEVGAKPEEVCNRYSSDSKSIETEIDNLAVAPSRANLFAAFSYLFGPDARPLNDPLVYVLSDLQASGWDEFQDGQSGSLIPDETELIVVDVGAGRPATNVAVVGDAPSDQQAIVGLPLVLRPQIKNFSAAESRQVALSVLVDEKEIARKNLTLKPGEQSTSEVIYTPRHPGPVRARYEIAQDAFSDDDTFLFTVDVAPRIRVLLVNGNPAPEPLDDEGLYLRTAMIATADTRSADGLDPDVAGTSPAGKGDGKQPDGKSDAESKKGATEGTSDLVTQQMRRSLDVLDLPEAKLNADTLRDADVVVLANCGALKADQFNLLCDYVARGGGLLILPGDKVNGDTYNKQFFTAPARPEESLLTVRLAAPTGDVEDEKTFSGLGEFDRAHPVLSVFADREQRYLAKVNVYRRFAVEFPENAGEARLIEFADGTPAVVENHFGTGRVLLSTFPFNTRWSNLPMRPEFVPLVLRMIGYVKRPAELRGPAVVRPGGAAEFTLAHAWAPASAKVTDIAGRVTPINFLRSQSQLKGAFDRTIQKGFYTVEVSGGQTESRKAGTLSFAVNVDAGESDFATVTGPQLKKLLPAADITTVDASAEAQQAHRSSGNEIWRWLIGLLFAIIGVEFFLSTFGGQAADGRPSAASRIQDLATGGWINRMTTVERRTESAESAERETVDSR